MMIHDITNMAGKYKARKRVGRGHGSGSGKTSGRGHKGAGSRAGHTHRPGFEGGQTPWARRLPKRGFTNAPFRTEYHVVNIGQLEARFNDGDEVNLETLVAKRLIRNTKSPLKILGEGELTKKLTVTAAKCSKSAVAKLEGAGGSVTLVPLTKWTRERSKPTARARVLAMKAAKQAAPAATEGASDA